MVLRRLMAALALVPLLVAGVQLPAQAAPERGDPGIGDPYFPLDGNGGIDVRRYSIRTAYDFSTGVLSGRTTIRLRATRALLTFNLDLLLPVRSVRVDGVRAGFHKPVTHELRIRPARPLVRGQVVDVEVRYAGRPGRRTYLGESSWLARRGEVAAVNEPHMAPWWFPANDHPRDAAVVDLRMRVPRGIQVIGNGLLRDVHRGRSTTLWHWRAAEPMAPYLAFFTAGRFRMERQSTPVGTSVIAVSRLLGEDAQAAALRVLRRTDERAQRLASLIGAPYPFSTTGGVVSGVLRGFALENQTRPVYPGFVSGDLVGHEIAHQWFGNRVRLHAWQHIWLNEGFATWFEEVLAGGESAAARRLRADYDLRSADDPFWLVPPGDPGRARIFDVAVYERGAMTLMALRNRIGDDDFDEVVRRWVGRDVSATTQAFTELAEQVSGDDLSAFFEAWLMSPTKPADAPELGLR